MACLLPSGLGSTLWRFYHDVEAISAAQGSDVRRGVDARLEGISRRGSI